MFYGIVIKRHFIDYHRLEHIRYTQKDGDQDRFVTTCFVFITHFLDLNNKWTSQPVNEWSA